MTINKSTQIYKCEMYIIKLDQTMHTGVYFKFSVKEL